MRLRAAQFACFLLLLSTLGAADASAQRSAEFGLRCQNICVLLQQGTVSAGTEAVLGNGGTAGSANTLPAASLAVYRAVWMQRPATAQAARMHAVTGSGI